MSEKKMQRKADNPRQISKAEYARLQADLERFGDLSGVIHNIRTGNLVGGNQRFSALDLAALEPVIIERYAEPTRTGTVAEGYFTQHGERFTYRQVDWDVATEDHACVAANRDGGAWDWEVLSGLDGETLGDWGFDEDRLRELNDDAANLREWLGAQEDEEVPEDPGAQTDRAEELQEKWGVQTGQLWEIGKHRLLCGDGIGGAERLGELPFNLFYDPPWDMEIDALPKFGNALAFCDGPRAQDVISRFGLPIWVFVWDCVTSWYTPNRPLRRAKLALWFGDIKNYDFNGAHYGDPLKPHTVRNTRGEYQFNPDSRGKHLSDVFQLGITKLHSEGEHPHEKPLDWIRLLVGNCFRGDVYDPFAGSGTTFAACEQLGRRCVGAEIEPKYVALTLQRLHDMGLTPRLA